MMRKLLFISLAVVLTTSSCKKDTGRAERDPYLYTKTLNIEDEIEQVKSVLQHLYLPVEMAAMFTDIQAPFDPGLLGNLKSPDKYVFSNEMAISLGVHGVDMGYARIYKQWNTSLLYLQNIMDLSMKLGVTAETFDQVSAYLDKPVYNTDTLKEIAVDLYLKIDAHFSSNNHYRASALVIFGGWAKAMHIALNLYATNKNEELILRVLEQRHSLFSVINLLESHSKDETVQNYLESLYNIQNLLNGLQVAFQSFEADKSDVFAEQALRANRLTLQNEINVLYGNIKF